MLTIRMKKRSLDKVPQSCAHLADMGVDFSGNYHIDPDGAGIGRPPIKVYCDFHAGG